ncbi:MAG: VWA domain-containing protein [Gammaproteobacteria bacterium]|nr:VWA domain-containing protein [Gammaproteobacteria bacterium]
MIGIFETIAATVTIIVAVYWLRQRVWVHRVYASATFLLLPAMLAVLLFVAGRGAGELEGVDDPLLLAIAADVSLSMGTMPDPDADVETRTRLERAQQAILPLFARLGANTRPTMISVTAFTSKSETILAWDDDLSLAREIIEYVLSIGLLTEAGSDVGVALNGVIPLFESLPEAYRDPARPKYLLLISDGEQTVTPGGTDIALSKLQELGVHIIALHVGLADAPEGLPVYAEDQSFIGFEEVDGKIFSVPDAEFMSLLAGDDPRTGLSVSAEDKNSAADILDFIGLRSAGPETGGLRSGAVILLWALLMIGLLRYGFEE